MGTRKLKVVSFDRADTESKQWVMQLSRPINLLEANGIMAIVNTALEEK